MMMIYIIIIIIIIIIYVYVQSKYILVFIIREHFFLFKNSL